MFEKGDGARRRNDATSENQAFSSVQPSGLTDEALPSPAAAMPNHFGQIVHLEPWEEVALHNSHAGEILVTEFLVPSLANTLASDPDELLAVVAGDKPISAELDAALCEHFCMSKGFFLRLQEDHEALEEKRSTGADQ